MAGIVIVTHNSAGAIGRCLDACIEVAGARVVVVDNASSDNTIDEVRKRPSVRLIANSGNRGFAAGVNQGFGMLQTEAVLILNPDTIIVRGVRELEMAVTSDDCVAAATGTLINADGTAQHGFNVRGFPTPLTLVLELLGVNRLWPSNPVNRRYRLRLRANTPIDIDQPAGAFLMVRHDIWRAVGGFDEQFYPVWFEDVDFCKRLRDRGFRILYVPAATAEHAGGHSVARLPWSLRQQVWYGSLLRYAWKHYPKAARSVVALVVIIGCLARTIGRATTELSLEPFTTWSRVVRLTSRYLHGELGGTSKSAFQQRGE
jgi:N-acetylglucosaminyl-diphospho-decaprenol L-rhamnosyltransferase